MRRDGSITCYRRLGWWEADMKGNSRGSALLDQNFFGSFLENPLRAVEWDLIFHEVPLDVREPIRSGPFVRYNDMLAPEFVDAM